MGGERVGANGLAMEGAFQRCEPRLAAAHIRHRRKGIRENLRGRPTSGPETGCDLLGPRRVKRE